MAGTLGWLTAIAFGAVGYAKAADPERRWGSPLPGPMGWVALVTAGQFGLLLIMQLGLLSRPGGVLLGLAQQVVWTAGLVVIVHLFRRARSVAFSDRTLTPVIPELLPYITAMQRRAPDAETDLLLDRARNAVRGGRGREALRCLSEVCDRLQQSLAPAGDDWAALHRRVSHLCWMNGLPRPSHAP
ncbi:hypothetical protein ACTVZO_41135 [Streptomyces sp. IBSNAI002]|uniref:hypothetical protein n=1 Tax=Streptomyces sp. IBSNAI002 TaxID=3457500 RepID=UPI003FCF4B43